MSHPQKVVVRFGEFKLDDLGASPRRAQEIKLQEQPLQILRVLLEEPGRVVPREEPQKRIWPSTRSSISDHGINNAVMSGHSALVECRCGLGSELRSSRPNRLPGELRANRNSSEYTASFLLADGTGIDRDECVFPGL